MKFFVITAVLPLSTPSQENLSVALPIIFLFVCPSKHFNNQIADLNCSTRLGRDTCKGDFFFGAEATVQFS